MIGHEFGHVIENRMIGKGVGARQGTHAGAMGEAFGDFDALEYLNAFHYAPVPGSDRWTEGAYVTGNHYNGIRDFLASRADGRAISRSPATTPKTDPLNLGDYGFDIVGARGARRRRDLGRGAVRPPRSLPRAATRRRAHGSTSPAHAAGRGRAVPGRPALDPGLLRRDGADAAATDDPPGPGRDARGRPGPLRRGQPGSALAGLRERGFGQLRDGDANGDTDPVPDFSSPLANNATLTFAARREENRRPGQARSIYVGDYQARSRRSPTPILARRARSNLDDTAQFVPNGPDAHGRQPALDVLQLHRGRAGLRPRPVPVRSLQAGETRNITIHFATNFASATQGATATGDTLGTNTNLPFVSDDDEGTIGGQTGAPVAGRRIVIRLGGVGPNGSNVKRLGVSAQLVPNTNRFTALRPSRRTSAAQGRHRATRRATGRSPLAGRRSSPLRRTHSRP